MTVSSPVTGDIVEITAFPAALFPHMIALIRTVKTRSKSSTSSMIAQKSVYQHPAEKCPPYHAYASTWQ